MFSIIDTYGAPQAGADITKFDTWDELEEYIWKDVENCYNDGSEVDEYSGYPEDSIIHRLNTGYAIVKEG